MEVPIVAGDKGTSSPSPGGPWLRAIRPRQWIKNGALLAGIIFTLPSGHPLSDWLRVLGAVAVFCLLASSIYLVNDVCDREQDRLHPQKQHRPIAAGLITPSAAIAGSCVLALVGLLAAALLGTQFLMVAAVYVLLTVSYSFWLKHHVIIDVMALAACYIVRVVAGTIVISVEISPWLLVCTTLAALLIGLGKRRSELVSLEDAGAHRRSLEGYTLGMLDQMIGVVTGSTLMTYMLYTFQSPTARGRPLLMLTIPFVVYGIFRFLYQIHRHGKGGDPSRDLVEDPALVVCITLWGLTCALIMYFGR